MVDVVVVVVVVVVVAVVVVVVVVVLVLLVEGETHAPAMHVLPAAPQLVPSASAPLTAQTPPKHVPLLHPCSVTHATPFRLKPEQLSTGRQLPMAQRPSPNEALVQLVPSSASRLT